MVTFTTIIQKFEKMGEKTGWTYIHIPAHLANEIKPNTRTSYRVKGKLDQFAIHQVALLPMGEGDFVIPINAAMRKGIKKSEGAMLQVALEVDESEYLISPDLLICLEDEPRALNAFVQLPLSHQRYYSKWIESAKTLETKSKRISQAVQGLMMGLDFGGMIRYFRDKG